MQRASNINLILNIEKTELHILAKIPILVPVLVLIILDFKCHFLYN